MYSSGCILPFPTCPIRTASVNERITLHALHSGENREIKGFRCSLRLPGSSIYWLVPPTE
uniref:Uncharacterized protein n=1 Tax=Picea glauca TaxID=3330 RepID=A0A101M524_PICGL|nr:hypothetical protein ABT39_MTgene1067 [Picea glauca]